MTTFLALPQPGPPPVLPVSPARAWSLRSEPSERPSIPAPPTRSKSRRVILRCGSQRSEQVPPVILIIFFPFLMVKQKSRAVDERPSQVLHGDEPFVLALLTAKL